MLACRRLHGKESTGAEGGLESRFASHFTSQEEMEEKQAIEVPKLSSRIKIESVMVAVPGRPKRRYTLRS